MTGKTLSHSNSRRRQTHGVARATLRTTACLVQVKQGAIKLKIIAELHLYSLPNVKAQGHSTEIKTQAKGIKQSR
jgi:hypothetical protein